MNNTLDTLTFQELKAKAKELGVKVENTDKKATIIGKIKDKLEEQSVTTQTKRLNRNRFKKRHKVIVTPRNPEEQRDSLTVIITNEVGTKTFLIPFNFKIIVPENVLKNIEERTYQKYVKTRVKNIGSFDKPIQDRAYNIEYVERNV